MSGPLPPLRPIRPARPPRCWMRLRRRRQKNTPCFHISICPFILTEMRHSQRSSQEGRKMLSSSVKPPDSLSQSILTRVPGRCRGLQVVCLCQGGKERGRRKERYTKIQPSSSRRAGAPSSTTSTGPRQAKIQHSSLSQVEGRPRCWVRSNA